MHNRDEILKSVMDERSGKRSSRKNRSSEIRDQVYGRRTDSRGRMQRPPRITQEEPVKQNRKKAKANKTAEKKTGLTLKKGISLKGIKNTPKLSDVLLPRDKKNAKDVIGAAQRSQRQMSNSIAEGIAVAVILCLVLFGVVHYVKYLQRSVVDNDTVTYDSIESSQKCTGVIVRDEVVYTSPADGEAVFNISDLDKVKAGTEICSVQDTAAVQSLQEDLDEINEKILEMQKNRESISAVTDEVKQYNSQIKAGADNYAFRLTSGDISVLYKMKGDVQKLIDTRNQRLLSENSGSLTELAEQRSEQQSRINSSKNAVTTQDAGIVSCYSDGLESVYTFDKMGDLTEKDIAVKNSGKVIDKIVTAGTPIFRIVRSNNWYIVSYIPNSQIGEWSVGDTVTIYLSEQDNTSRPLEMSIESLNTNDKTSLVILKSTKYLSDYINQRSVTFETRKALKGYKIPNKAIVEETLLKVSSEFVIGDKVYKANGTNPLIEVSVNKSSENPEEGITYIEFDINKINVGDVLTLPSDTSKTFTISDVVTERGVYVMNTGEAVFKKINLENSAVNQNFTVLDPAVNPNVKIYDRIVTDTANTEKEQKLID